MHLKKGILPLLICLSLAAGAQSQSKFDALARPVFNRKLQQHVATILKSQVTNIKAKTTATKERLKAQASILASSLVFDTTAYQYSGDRGSVYDLSYMSYNDLYSIDMTPKSFPYVPGNISVKADTLSYWKDDNGSLVLDKNARTSYTSSKAIDAYKEYNYANGSYDWTDQHNHIYANGVLQQINTLSDYSTGSLDSLDKSIMQYDAQGRLIKQRVYTYDSGMWTDIAEVSYSYDGLGNLTDLKTRLNMGAGWYDQSELVHTYYPGGRLQTVTLYENDGNALAPSTRDSFEYSGGLPYITGLTEQAYDPAEQQWVNVTMMAKHIDPQSLPDTVDYFAYDELAQSWIPTSRLVASYTSFGNPESISIYTDPLHSGSLSYLGKILYYYEQYTVTGTDDIPAKQMVSVYPNPARDRIVVRLENAGEHTLSLIDLLGKVLVRERSSEQQHSLDLSAFAAGTYMLEVQGKTGRQTISVVKW